MNLSEPFINRPVATTLLVVAIALAGGVAFKVLPVSPLPQVDFPTISVSAQLPGASPEIMASSVATPLERQLGHIAGVAEMTSSSYLGSTSITLQFDLSRNIDGAARDVEAAINAARTFLPANLPANPSYRKVNPADAPIMILSLTSKVYDPGKLYDLASTILQQRLSQIQGVGQVIVGGSSLPAVRVELNPMQLNSYGLGFPDVASVLNTQNSNRPKGQLADDFTTSDITTNDQISKAVDYKPLIIGYHSGAAVRLEDVADVVDSTQNLRSAGYMNGAPAVNLIIFRAPGANIIDTVDRIRASTPVLAASLPSAVDLTTVMDRTTTIRASVSDVERTLVISILLVILVVFLFLRNFRTTIIPAVAVPVSLIGTFGIMYFFGYSLDNLSLMALTISTGFVVDDAIVVIENINRYIEQGTKPLEASLRGAREIGFTVLTISVSLIAVFIPILLMNGIVGRLFREFAITLSAAILVSLAISLTATPMMCAVLLEEKKQKKEPNRLYAWSEKVFEATLGFYERTLKTVLEHPAITLSVLILTIVLNVVLFVIVPKGFFPEQDNGTVFGGMQGSQDISFQAMDSMTKQFVNIIKEDPAVGHVVAFTGGNGATNGGFIYIELKPLEQRKITSSQVINRLRPKLSAVSGGTAFMQAGQDVRIGGRQSNAQYQYTIQSDNQEDLSKWGPTLLQEMKKIPGLTDVNSDQQNKGLQVALEYDRPTAARLAITPKLIDQTLYNAFGQSLVSTIYTPLNQYFVVMEVAPRFWQNPAILNDIYIHSPSGGMVPLGAVAHFSEKTAPLAVNHQSQFPSVTVSFNLAANTSLGEASGKIEAMEKKIGMPSTIRGMFAGTLEAFKESLASEPLLILTALIAVYIVLGILYESYIHPITILSTLPSAGGGAVLALLLFKMDLSVVALIGIILLIGIVKKNAILMIDFALSAERNERKNSRDAVFEACLLRFRPILMTTMAALFGAIPLAFGEGAGSELRRPLGIAIIGGLLVSQVLTLYTTPVVYLYMDRLQIWLKNSKKVRNLKPAMASVVLCLLFFHLGCSTGPKYNKPATSVPANFKEGGGSETDWKSAKPNDATNHGKWWEVFKDADLNALEDQVNVNNQNIAAAVANYNTARATVREAQAQYFPTLSVAPSVITQQATALPHTAPSKFTIYSLPVEASWAPDLFGRIENLVKQDVAAAQMSAADLENERLLEQATLAMDYFQLRNQDSLIQMFDQTIKDDQESLNLTRTLMKTGIGNDSAVAQAETQLESTQAKGTDLKIARAKYEHAIALLVGKPASSFSINAAPLTAALPVVPVGIPSQLLERRPDIASAERSVAAANAGIGVAMAAYFPNLTLNASAGLQAYTFSDLLNAPAFVWSLGATLAETVFDGGLREATVEKSKAEYAKTVALYRQTVLTAFQQVEDGLSSLRILAEEIQQQQAAVNSGQRSLKLAQDRYRLGVDTYLNVIVVQISLLGDQQTLINLQMQQMTTSVQLIEALGGDWDVSKLPSVTGGKKEPH